MKTNFQQLNWDNIKKAQDFIVNNMKEGQTIRFATQEQLDENTELISELPFFSHVDKHGNYDEYGITHITKVDGDPYNNIQVFGVNKNSEINDEWSVSLENVDQIFALADAVAEKL